ncbi:MAG: DUF4396 domain-containing protein [Anaerolineales bacterium]|nr:DUF4396 domain-containing protein [Anaerolineales bacterium]
MNTFLIIWFASAFLAALWTAYDLITEQPKIMPVIKVAWVLVILYLGIIGLILYNLSCRAPTKISHDEYVSPMWKRALGSTIHCVSGDALGIVMVAVIIYNAHLPMLAEFAIEYAFAFLFGWLIFQVPPIMVFMGKSFREALLDGLRAEFVSLTAMVAGMFPTMYLLMKAAGGSGGHMPSPLSLEFWGMMSASIAIGFIVTYPVSWWMVSVGWKRGMGSALVLGEGGDSARMTTDKPMLLRRS